MRALRAEGGSLLVFLPGQAEIRRTETLLKERVTDPATDIVALYGALDAQVQDRAIEPSPPGRRKVVLATSIAETSLTIEGVRVVIDSGLARVPRFEPGVGLTRLETVRVSRAAADQRRGRAGRTEPGVCYRLWSEPETASLEAYARPEILSADLSSLRARSRAMGRQRSGQARLSRSAAAGCLLRSAQAADGIVRARCRRPHHRRRPRACGRCRCRRGSRAWWSMPRATAMARCAAQTRRAGHRARSRRQRCRSHASARSVSPRSLPPRRGSARHGEAVGLLRHSGARRQARPGTTKRRGALLALAYPDRVAKNRGGGQGGFLLANGRGAMLDPALSLAREPFIVAAELVRHRGAGAHPARGRDLASRNRTHLRRPDRSARRSHRRSRDA